MNWPFKRKGDGLMKVPPRRCPALFSAGKAANALGIVEALLVTTMLGSAIMVLSRAAAHKRTQSAKEAHGAAPSCQGRAERVQDAARDEDPALHWHLLTERLPKDMRKLGMTERQAQVGMGIISQKTYRDIAKDMRLDERTVRQHATHAFQKVGCTKRSEFLESVLEALMHEQR